MNLQKCNVVLQPKMTRRQSSWTRPGRLGKDAVASMSLQSKLPEPFWQQAQMFQPRMRTCLTPACGPSSPVSLDWNHRWIFGRDRPAPRHLKPRRDHFFSHISVVPTPPIMHVQCMMTKRDRRRHELQKVVLHQTLGLNSDSCTIFVRNRSGRASTYF